MFEKNECLFWEGEVFSSYISRYSQRESPSCVYQTGSSWTYSKIGCERSIWRKQKVPSDGEVHTVRENKYSFGSEPASRSQSQRGNCRTTYRLYEPLLQATIVQRILYSFLSIYLDRAEQGVDTLGCLVGNHRAALPSFELY